MQVKNDHYHTLRIYASLPSVDACADVRTFGKHVDVLLRFRASKELETTFDTFIHRHASLAEAAPVSYMKQTPRAALYTVTTSPQRSKNVPLVPTGCITM